MDLPLAMGQKDCLNLSSSIPHPVRNRKGKFLVLAEDTYRFTMFLMTFLRYEEAPSLHLIELTFSRESE